MSKILDKIILILRDILICLVNFCAVLGMVIIAVKVFLWYAYLLLGGMK